MARTVTAQTCLRIAFSRSIRGRASASGISRRFITTCGIWTTCPRRSSSPCGTTGSASTPWRTPARPASCTSSTASRASRCGRSKNGRCLRAARRARQSWPTQPFPTKPAPFGRQTFTVDDVNPWLLTPEQYTTLRERIAKAHVGPGSAGRPLHSDRRRRGLDFDAGQHGRFELGDDRLRSREGHRLRPEHGGAVAASPRGRAAARGAGPRRRPRRSGVGGLHDLPAELPGLSRRRLARCGARRGVACRRHDAAQ